MKKRERRTVKSDERKREMKVMMNKEPCIALKREPPNTPATPNM
jgi:hypothetical protein